MHPSGVRPSRPFPAISHFFPDEAATPDRFPRPAFRFPQMIRLVDVYKAFGPKRVLEGFTLDVVEGETMVIIGYSGTGKSVAIKHIVGLLEPDKGQVIVELIPEAAPEHVARIKELARAKFYDGLNFFRVIDDFMAQTGDPQNTGMGGSDKPDLKAEFTFRRAKDSPIAFYVSGPEQVAGFLRSLPVVSEADAGMATAAGSAWASISTFCCAVSGAAGRSVVSPSVTFSAL